MKLFFINCSILLAFLLFSGKCLADYTAKQILGLVPQQFKHNFHFISTNGEPPSEFDEKDRNVIHLQRKSKICVEAPSDRLLDEVTELLTPDYIEENYPKDAASEELVKLVKRLHKWCTPPGRYTKQQVELVEEQTLKIIIYYVIGHILMYVQLKHAERRFLLQLQGYCLPPQPMP